MTQKDVNTLMLPQGWTWTKLGDVADINPELPCTLQDDTEVTFLPMKSVEELTGRYDTSTTVTYAKVKKGYTSFANGDIIFAKITPCMENGKVAVVDNLRNGVGFGSTEFHVVRPLLSESPRKYLFYYLIQEVFRRDAKREMTGSAGQLRVPARYMQNTRLPLPPLNEQVRIVARLEELFARLDAGVEGLRKVKAQLKRYRQAVLKYAFEGKLTEEWRKIHRDQIEPATKLLEHIKQERRKDPKYKEPPPIDSSELPELPQGWIWVRLGGMSGTTSGGTPSRKKKQYYGGKIPWLKSGELKDGVINATEESITDEGLANSSTRIIPKGTLLIALYGATVGKLGVLGIDSAINQAICAIFPNGGISRDFLFWYLRKHRDELLNIRKGGAQPNISQDVVRNIVLPLPSLQEQQKIVEEIENRMSSMKEVESVLEKSLKQAERLRQGILKQAFEGKLVAQDPSDEPADKLLERIKEESAKSKGEKDTNKGRKNMHRQLELSTYVE